MLAYKVITEYASAVYGNLVMTLQGELLFFSVSYIFTHGKLLGCGESELRN